MPAKRYNPATEMFAGDLISFQVEKVNDPVWYLVVEIEPRQALTKSRKTELLAPSQVVRGARYNFTNIKCLHVEKQEYFNFECEIGQTLDLILVRPT